MRKQKAFFRNQLWLYFGGSAPVGGAGGAGSARGVVAAGGAGSSSEEKPVETGDRPFITGSSGGQGGEEGAGSVDSSGNKPGIYNTEGYNIDKNIPGTLFESDYFTTVV